VVNPSPPPTICPLPVCRLYWPPERLLGHVDVNSQAGDMCVLSTSAVVADCTPFGLPLLLIMLYQVGIRMHYGE
jgi:hypothetical protein